MKIASAERVDRTTMEEFVRPRHKGTLITHRKNGRLQISPITCGLDSEGRLVISTYPERAKAINLQRDPSCSVLIHSDDWDDPYIQLDGTAEVITLPDSVEPLVEYFRVIAGEHSDWDEYRAAMVRQGKCLIRITIDEWGPLARGGFPPDRVG